MRLLHLPEMLLHVELIARDGRGSRHGLRLDEPRPAGAARVALELDGAGRASPDVLVVDAVGVLRRYLDTSVLEGFGCFACPGVRGIFVS